MRQGELGQAVLANPSKALEIPLLDKESKGDSGDILAVEENDGVCGLNKSLFGAMAADVVTLAIANLLKGRDLQVEEECALDIPSRLTSTR